MHIAAMALNPASKICSYLLGTSVKAVHSGIWWHLTPEDLLEIMSSYGGCLARGARCWIFQHEMVHIVRKCAKVEHWTSRTALHFHYLVHVAILFCSTKDRASVSLCRKIVQCYERTTSLTFDWDDTLRLAQHIDRLDEMRCVALTEKKLNDGPGAARPQIR